MGASLSGVEGTARAAEPWRVAFGPASGKGMESLAVPVRNGGLLVAVVAPGATPANPSLRHGQAPVPTGVVGFDPVSRLCFLNPGNATASAPAAATWLEQATDPSGETLRAVGPTGSIAARGGGWVQQIEGKILPLALLRVNFSGPMPMPGTPIMNQAGQIVAIHFQAAGIANVGYALPAAAVLRVCRDIQSQGRLVRGRLGLVLSADAPQPQVVRVLAGTPAAKVGIQPGDILKHVGCRAVGGYPDAVNAFFYLVPGESVRVNLTRAGAEMEFNLVPDPG